MTVRREMIAVLLMGIMCLVILRVTVLNLSVTYENNSRELYERLYHRAHSLESAALQSLSPSCVQNVSASNVTGFSTLPNHIKDFLLYRHCREFPLLLDVRNKCGGPQNSADVFLLLVIKSSPENFERREVLRKTWATEQQYNGVWIRRVFIIGTIGTGLEKLRLNKILKYENHENQDILQWDFNDSFFNLTLKQILFLQWMDKWCPHTRFILNGDDDVFANTFNMVKYLQGLKDNNGSKHLYVGQVMENTRPFRHSSSKYYVPVQVYQSDIYPPYCTGGGFLLSGFTARTIYSMNYNVTLSPIDDAYIGMCLEKAGLKPMSHIGVRIDGMHLLKVDRYHPCHYREMLLVHRFLPQQIFGMWNEIQDPHLQCGKTKSFM
ncbi:N-acetyllactosaminide beta-1,3-N-acetylglucosaminyltransferase 3-like [Myxocyprinus asiaticus]|uniref:N-acetyllactosaminide beta-1,3-N-acetylglucosaminyltransferase 3-like n=1 Tax=Myxocyprinus asiaticus TaxID=70543 RepID=UPI0022234F5C|nr:N-acetyllactosaminide beta-1,3-N-acetylglucosaminyltransferase 3-like [Myxocyprinus asiaticus]XP_051524349.1 N-acetyllactosaminide beta-1,3-N-acetylglucosaminyltransferase 3-like [Myxocyprinus asiaticus]XP_051524350.1 N-acetyllactosaminide beta-1,3-N-acetylglucosaminyltransferase 3-like [Myxocyprinus asiaticus]XP_051524351.1 N-acetyllactosaminide beta-1,3-N-acetylglucosaminyltransferase 3-like [Myxocyprinus asiaticus]XP_051524352.1 N-acetyllactosaminide beta-1,3-N-acetylglucosaminyltransfera